ncbi:NLI interacting factor-like phosphatase [Opisthorchis viverrini]|uniref:NLI interacting factor-like phosphatase n=1 Tax=Opisthorchis viverrini TaxID=6198 RepID=A0A1S8X1S9_OPIVI|nr:NLI interacting factor-like phosphatase [Opisthorchis viverrini]
MDFCGLQAPFIFIRLATMERILLCISKADSGAFQHTGFLYLNGYFALSDLMFNLHIKVIFIGFIIHFTGTLRRKVMVLDLDETLIHSVHDGTLRPTVRPGTPPDFVLKVDIDHHPVRFSVHKRPHVDFFLNVWWKPDVENPQADGACAHPCPPEKCTLPKTTCMHKKGYCIWHG